MLHSKLWVVLTLFISLIISSCTTPKHILNLNVFDQLQGQWEPDFREKRMAELSQWILVHKPDLVVFQEARGEGNDSVDGKLLHQIYPYRRYVHEMTGADGASYGYWMGAREAPTQEWSDGFSFPGGVARKTQAALWKSSSGCLGVLSLHLSYQSSEVRQKEARWVLDWLEDHKSSCPDWLVMGDFNADEEDKEIQILIAGGLHSMVKDKKPTVGAFNPIRQIYGKDVPSRTIDWIWSNSGRAGQGEVVFDSPMNGLWISDHAGIDLRLGQ